MRVSALSLIPVVALGFSVGCIIREVPAGSQPATAAPPPAAPPPAAPPPAAAPAGAEAKPPVVAAPPAPGTPPAPAPKPASPVPGPFLAPKPGLPGTVVGAPPVKFAPPAMKANNAFGSPTAIPGSLQGFVYDIPANSTALPSFAQLTPFGTLYTTSFDIAPRDFKEGFPGLGDRVEWFAIRWEGKVTAKTAGGHLFHIKSDDGARLFIDGQRIVDNDGLHAPKDATGQANLAAGEHNLVIEYFQGPKYQIALQIWVSSPNTPEKILTTSF